ncbi:galanin receptor type 1-like [Acanthaster planci]|uniref:Galanin receptor type 1-like n=1 Tax=Acanthaster planci TaxID=133434 RepID=A0A8B7YQP8_ACAPL|nr:galanin receptor type 1-like [Acanthaster planci]
MSAANDSTAEGTPNGVVSAVLMTLEVIGILGNTLVCFTILRAKFMHTTTNYLIAHLALADLLVCATFLGFQKRFIPSNLDDPLLCVLFKAHFLVWLAVGVSTASMVLVTAERYIAIVHPLHYPRYLSNWRVKLGIAGIWLLSVPLASIQIFVPKTIADMRSCLQDLTVPLDTLKAAYAFHVALYVIPMLILFYCYGRVMVNLHRKARQYRKDNNQAHAEGLIRAQRKVAIVLLIVAVVYITVWFTIIFSNLYLLFNEVADCNTQEIFRLLYPVLLVFNSVVNPIIYAFKYKEFQRGVREAMFPRCLTRLHRVGVRGDDIAMG